MSALLQDGFDVLDMKNYRMEKLPKREKLKFERFLMRIGGPLAILSFVLILFVLKIPFLDFTSLFVVIGGMLCGLFVMYPAGTVFRGISAIRLMFSHINGKTEILEKEIESIPLGVIYFPAYRMVATYLAVRQRMRPTGSQ